MRASPKPAIFLDASAVLAYLKREPGFERVRAALDTGAAICTVNLAEVYARVVATGLALQPVARRLEALGLSAEPFTEADARNSARLSGETRPAGLSLGDRACLALGLRLATPVLTADRTWAQLAAGVEVQLIRSAACRSATGRRGRNRLPFAPCGGRRAAFDERAHVRVPSGRARDSSRHSRQTELWAQGVGGRVNQPARRPAAVAHHLPEVSPQVPEPPPSQFLDVRGVRTHLRERGSGPPLLLLHGAGGAGPWRPYHDALAERFRLLVPDHPGFGASDRPDWVETIEDVVYHYLDFLDVLGLARTHLVGASLGGWIAAEIAVAHPEVVDRLVLVDPAGLKVPGMALPDLFALTEEETTRLIFYDQQLAEAQLAEADGPEATRQRIKNQSTFARLAWNPYLYNPRLGRRLYRVQAPTLIVWGRHDRVIPVENADLWLNGIPHATLAVIDHCGHVPHRERPEELARLAAGFLEAEARVANSR